MNDRWNECSRVARTADTEPVPPVPFGFATRVLRNLSPTVADRLELWMIFARRGLAFASVATMIAAALAWWDYYPAMAIETPAVADEAIEQVLWQP